MKKLIQFAKPIVERFPRLAMSYRSARDSWEAYEEPQKTPMGFKLAGGDGTALMKNGQHEPEETQIVKRILSSVDIVINVGANVGYYCCIALSKEKYVVAFEPINLNLRYLLANIKANNWESRIEVYPMALSNKVSVIEMYGNATGSSLLKEWSRVPERYVALVPSTTLDNALDKRFQGKRCLIIVDIEGTEKFMLEGASLMIDMLPKPIWMMEILIFEPLSNVNSINPNLLSTFRIFRDNGYEAFTADRQCRVIYPDEVEKIVESGIDTLHTTNFLFIEEGKKHEFFNV